MSALATVHSLETWRVFRRLAGYHNRCGWSLDRPGETPEWFAANAIDPATVVGLGSFRAVVDDVCAAARRYGFRFVPEATCVVLTSQPITKGCA
jgi:hypothetical protein